MIRYLRVEQTETVERWQVEFYVMPKSPIPDGVAWVSVTQTPGRRPVAQFLGMIAGPLADDWDLTTSLLEACRMRWIGIRRPPHRF